MRMEPAYSLVITLTSVKGIKMKSPTALNFHVNLSNSWAFTIVGFFIQDCQFIKSFRPFPSILRGDILGKITPLSYQDYSISGSFSQQSSGIPLKLLCLFSSIILSITENFRGSRLLNQYRTHMTFSHKIRAKTFTWPDVPIEGIKPAQPILY